jgi:hypothetical protein
MRLMEGAADTHTPCQLFGGRRWGVGARDTAGGQADVQVPALHAGQELRHAKLRCKLQRGQRDGGRTCKVAAASAAPGSGTRVHSSRTTAPPSPPCTSRRATCHRGGGAEGGGIEPAGAARARGADGVSMRDPMMIFAQRVSAVTQRWYLRGREHGGGRRRRRSTWRTSRCRPRLQLSSGQGCRRGGSGRRA